MKFITFFTCLSATLSIACPTGKAGPEGTNRAAIAAPKKGKEASNSTVSTGGSRPVPANTTASAPATGGVLPDGRIQQAAVATDFNVLASVFKSAVVKGDGLLFSDIIQFPAVPQSLFDVATNTKAFEVTLSDKSIFIPKGGVADTATRRADLLPSIRSTLANIATTGVKTMHFSIMQDAAKPLNMSHSYQVAFLETADFATHQFDVRMGTGEGADGTNIVVNGNSKTAGGAPVIFQTPLTAGFNNFAVRMDFAQNTMQVFHSVDNAPLASVTAAVANDMTGNGEYHFGMVKNAIGGAQPAGIDEGMIFGGIFMEDSANGQVTLR